MKRRYSSQKKRADAISGHLFLLPANILLFVFLILPIFLAVLLSLVKYNGFGAVEWVGLQNYVEVFRDRDFLVSLKNTLIYVVVTVPLQTVIPLVLAAILAEKFRNLFGEFVRGTLFIPVLCSAVLAGTVFYYLFASDSESAANLFLAMFGLDKQNWLGQRSTALMVICLVAIWKNVGYYLVILYAGIMDIPRDLYEAARIDGATSWQQFLYITIPNLKTVLTLVVTLGTIWAFQVFDITMVMTGGGPGNVTMSPVLLIYKTAFSSRRMGYASAMACVLAVIIFIVTILQRVVQNGKDGDGNV